MIGTKQRPLPDNRLHSQQTDIHAPGGIRIRTLNPTKRQPQTLALDRAIAGIFIYPETKYLTIYFPRKRPASSNAMSVALSIIGIPLLLVQPATKRRCLKESSNFLNLMVAHKGLRLGYLSRYSDSLRAGRSGDRITVGARFSAPVQTGPRAHPASSTMSTGSFPGVKPPGRGADPPPPSSVPNS